MLHAHRHSRPKEGLWIHCHLTCLVSWCSWFDNITSLCFLKHSISSSQFSGHSYAWNGEALRAWSKAKKRSYNDCIMWRRPLSEKVTFLRVCKHDHRFVCGDHNMIIMLTWIRDDGSPHASAKLWHGPLTGGDHCQWYSIKQQFNKLHMHAPYTSVIAAGDNNQIHYLATELGKRHCQNKLSVYCQRQKCGPRTADTYMRYVVWGYSLGLPEEGTSVA